MPFEKSAGAVVFRRGRQIEYLLLNAVSESAGKSQWVFPKGIIERGETTEQAAKREVLEETGLKDIVFIKGFEAYIKYFFRRKTGKKLPRAPFPASQNRGQGKGRSHTVFKVVVFLLAETRDKGVKISSEHIGYIWLPYERAIQKLTFKNSKNVLQKAHNFLLENEIRKK